MPWRAKTMSVSTADLLQLMTPGSRPTDREITEIRDWLADRHDGPARRECADSDDATQDFDRAAVDAITTVYPQIPDVVDVGEIGQWIDLLGTTIVLPLRLRSCVVNLIDDEGNEYYAPRWYERRNHVDIIAVSRGDLRQP